jgi:hypothetical protein
MSTKQDAENSAMVVARKYRLLSPISIKNGTFDKDGAKKLIHDNKIIPREFVEQRNSFNNNELYVIDKKATELYLKQREEQILINQEKAKKDKLSVSDLVDAIKGNNNPKN